MEKNTFGLIQSYRAPDQAIDDEQTQTLERNKTYHGYMTVILISM